jgi:uncharacterized membrane protein HdeD (DUF308 family)
MDQIESSFKRVWRTLAVRGVVSILFGVVLIAWPDISLKAMVIVFGAFVAAQGVVELAAAVRVRLPGRERLFLVVQGIVSIAFGVVSFLYTDMTQLALLYVIAAWAIAKGAIEIVAAIRLPFSRNTKILVGLTGVFSVAFGVLMFISPDDGALALVALIAALAITTGTLMVVYAFELRRTPRRLREQFASQASAETVAQS